MVGTKDLQQAEVISNSPGALADQLEEHAANVTKLETFYEETRAILAAIDLGDLLADIYQNEPGLKERHDTVTGLLAMMRRKAEEADQFADGDLAFNMVPLARGVRALG